MAENVLETRIQLRYGTYSEWMNSSVILLNGEVAIATFPRGNTIENLSNAQPLHTPPAIGLKVGDGYHYFYELPWVQAVSADVYSWAKSSTKPVYSAEEIVNLDSYISQHSGGDGGGSASSAYRIIYNQDTNTYILQQYDDESEDWVNTASEINLSAIINRLAAIENWANGAYNDIGNIETPLVAYISDAVSAAVGRLDVTDEKIEHEFVTSVHQENGRITVQRSTLDASDITTGVLSTAQGGTGFTNVGENEILIGSNTGNLKKTNITTNLNNEDNNAIPTAQAVTNYVAQQTAGLTGAMHFIGEASVPITDNSRVNPQISGYNFRLAAGGDVILFDAKEFVWTGYNWRLLGDEGSYAIKGSITNTDIADEANISITKIANLQEILNSKVAIEEGKQLSTNDYTSEEKQKLANIEDNAQQNIIEHIFLNEKEISPKVIDGLPKSISLSFLSLTQDQIDKLDRIEDSAQRNLIEHILLNNEEVKPATIESVPNTVNLQIEEFDSNSRDKLNTIATGAQVNTIEKIIFDGEELKPDANKVITITSNPHSEHENKIESIIINGTEYQPNKDKQVNIRIDPDALNLKVLTGAQVPNGANMQEVEQVGKKLQLARIAATGDVKDILQSNDEYITLYCGSSTQVI